MNAKEALSIVRIVRAACPAQKLDEYTIDVWADALADTDFGEAREAVRRLVRRQPFIAVSEIIGEVAQHRRDAMRRLASLDTLRAIEQAKRDSSTVEAEAARREARAAFERAIAKHESEAS